MGDYFPHLDNCLEASSGWNATSGWYEMKVSLATLPAESHFTYTPTGFAEHLLLNILESDKFFI